MNYNLAVVELVNKELRKKTIYNNNFFYNPLNLSWIYELISFINKYF